ncbi:MAG: tetratricopeptide repeat protein [Methylobacter sp.]|nr:tetratricopeptide repeat protein [Methylobacter sp.]
MEIYDTEEERLEAFKRWWKESGSSIVVGLAVGLAIILGWGYWQDYRKDQAAQASVLYDQLLKAVETDKKDSAEKLAERMQKQFDGTEYAAYSGLLLAKSKVQQGDFAAAKETLKKIAAGSNNELKNVATLRLVRLMLANGEYEQGLQLIAEVDASETSNFAGSYDELVGDLYVALDRLDEARTSYQKALRNGHRSPLLQFKIDDLSILENADSQK